MPDSNLERLMAVAALLRPLLEELVFVGGAVTGLLVSDEATGEPRPTLDVDAIAEITSYAQYAAFGERLRKLGFSEDMSAGAPLCRWVHKGAILDVMPLEANVLGFSNRWYRTALESSVTRRIAADLWIRIVTAPVFLATKLEAFKGRGRGDYFTSHDLEDLVFVIDGRPTIADEIRNEIPEVRDLLVTEARLLIASQDFTDALPGYFLPDAASQARINVVLRRLKDIASL